MSFNLADLFEHAVDEVGDRPALYCGADERTFAQLEARANALAHHFISIGLGAGDHIGIYGWNSIGWVEAMLAAFKVRAVPVNTNYRYVTSELRYLFDNADLRAVVCDRRYATRVAEVAGDIDGLDHVIILADPPEATDDAVADQDQVEAAITRLGAVTIDEAIAAHSSDRDFSARSSDDLVIIYTGGTTGMPKGVMWRAEDIFYALAGGIDPFSREPVTSEWEQSRKAAASPGQLVFGTLPPLMHGAAFIGTLMQLFQGNQNVLVARFDPAEVWRTIAARRINSVLITGDAMGRPLIEALEALEALEADGEELDLSCLISLSSSAAVFSPTVKDRFLARFEHLVLTDSIGSTEGGFNGIVAIAPNDTSSHAGGPNVAPGRDTTVLDDDGRPVAAGSGVVGKVARSGNIPLGYYNDEAKTAATFITAADGVRYAVPGDFATVEADGTITLLGRGSACINTGGEKVYPEEVESVLKAHPAVFDALVVGVADDRWGQRVTAVVQAREGMTPTLEEVDAHVRAHLAAYKTPKELHLVEQVQRSPSGKPDYPWAKHVAEQASQSR